jgi:hypothetical protein
MSAERFGANEDGRERRLRSHVSRLAWATKVAWEAWEAWEASWHDSSFAAAAHGRPKPGRRRWMARSI